MKRIIIIGCGGAGKSTLARQLGEKLNLPVVHLDKLFWRPNWISVSQEEFDELHRRELAKETWILDGNFNRTMPERIARCDTVIYLDFSRFACLMGVARRIVHCGTADLMEIVVHFKVFQNLYTHPFRLGRCNI